MKHWSRRTRFRLVVVVTTALTYAVLLAQVADAKYLW